VLAIRTSVLEEKATACNMICCYADELKEGFFPYVQQVRGRGERGCVSCDEMRDEGRRRVLRGSKYGEGGGGGFVEECVSVLRSFV
jgi:hypothetical protein